MDNTKVVIGGDTAGAVAAVRRLEDVLGGLGGPLAKATAQFNTLRGVLVGIPALGAAIAGALSVSKFVDGIKGAIDAADHLNDLSQRLGVSAAELAKYKFVAEASGTSLEGVAGAVKHLSSYMVEHGAVLKQIGVTTADSNQALIQLSDIFAHMPDGPEKTALAVKLFGRSGLEMIPILNMGSKALAEQIAVGGEYASRMSEMAKQADKFNDQLLAFEKGMDKWKKSVAADFLPAGNDILQWMLKAQKEGGTLLAILTGIGVAMAKGAGIEINPLKRAQSRSQEAFTKLGAAQAAFAKQQAVATDAQDDIDPTNRWLQDWRLKSRQAALVAAQREMKNAMAAQRKLEKQAAADFDAENAPRTGKEGDAKSLLDAGGAAEKAAEQYKKLIESIREKIAVNELEIGGGQKLSEGDKRAMEIMVQLRDGTLNLSAAKKIAVSAELERLIASDRAIESSKRDKENMEERVKVLGKMAEAEAKVDQVIERARQAQADRQADVRFEIEMAGKTVEQRELAVKLRQIDVQLARDLASAENELGNRVTDDGMNPDLSGRQDQLRGDAAKAREETINAQIELNRVAAEKLNEELIAQNMNRGELEWQLHEENMAQLEEAHVSTEAEERRHYLARIAIEEQYLATKRATDKSVQDSVMQAGSSLYQLLSMHGMKNSALAKTIFLAMKAVQVAQIVSQSQTAAALAEAGLLANAGTTAATLGPYAGPIYFAAAAADAAATGMAIRMLGYVNAGLTAAIGISELAGAGQGSGGAGVGATGGGGYMAPMYGNESMTPMAPASVPAVQGKAAEVRFVNLTVVGERGFTAQQVREELIPLLNEAAGDGVEIRVTTN